MVNKQQKLALEQLNSELQGFYDSCKEANLSEEDIRKIADSLLFATKSTTTAKFYLKLFLVGLIVVAVLGYAIANIEVLAWHAAAIGRLAMIKILPYWDWQFLKNEKCLVPNLLNSATSKFAEPDFPCALCEAVERVRIETDLDHEYLKLHRPVIIEDSLRNWVDGNFNFTLFRTEISQTAKLADSTPCRIRTNIHNGDRPTLFDLMDKLGRFDSYFLHLQNCDFGATKAFRPFAPKPHFLPPATSPIQYSWLLLSRNYKIEKFKPIDLQEPLTIIGQIHGKNYFKLLPRRNCASECPAPVVQLQPGQALVLTSLWDLEYKPKEGSLNMAVILELH